jgi:PAS domain S-box-containing protein
MVKRSSNNESTGKEQIFEPFQNLVEMSPDSIFVHDKNGRITYLNAAGLRLLGALEKTEVIGRKFSDLLSEKSPILSRVKKRSYEGVTGSPIEGRN